MQLGYCTNVHAGADLAQTRANLDRYARAVRQRIGRAEPLGIGLWLSAATARALRHGDELTAFRDWLTEAGLLPYTINGFPFGDFHQSVVKHQVYLPTWKTRARLDYTLDLIHILDALLPPGVEGSISTLPLAWGKPVPSEAELMEYGQVLLIVADYLQLLERESGRLIHLCVEPEPGCVLQRSRDIVDFLEGHVFRGGDEPELRRHIRICHDVCHAAVMFEDQAEVLRRYRSAGIQVGKVQVSSAVRLAPASLSHNEQRLALEQLAGFHEPRYLHQTMVRHAPDAEPIFYEDLSLALAAERDRLDSEWRVHFHVPIYLKSFGRLQATQDAILECLRETANDNVPHFEAETYAWTVLPRPLQQPDLATGIADEITWLRDTWQTLRHG